MTEHVKTEIAAGIMTLTLARPDKLFDPQILRGLAERKPRFHGDEEVLQEAAAGQLTEQEWSEFTADVITPHLPDGFTAFDADGQWMNPITRRIIAEKTKVLLVVLPGTEAGANAVAAIRDAYQTKFHQHSVGIAVHPVCGAF